MNADDFNPIKARQHRLEAEEARRGERAAAVLLQRATNLLERALRVIREQGTPELLADVEAFLRRRP